MSAQPVPMRSSIIIRLLKLVFSFYLLVTVTVTLIHIGAEYRHTRESVLRELEAFREMFEPVLKQGLWRLDPLQWELTVEGMMTSPTLTGVRIQDEYGVILKSIGTVVDENGDIVMVDASRNKTPLRRKDTFYSNLFEYNFEIRNDKYRLGEATLYSSNAVVFQKLKIGIGFIILNAIIKTLALWFFFVWIGRRVVSEPLFRLSDAVEQIDLENLQESRISVETGGQNEIWALQNAFNLMLAKLAWSIQEREMVEAEKNRLYTAIEQADEEVIITGTDGKILYANPALEDTSGYTREELAGEHLRIFRSDAEDPVRYHEMETALFSGRIYKGHLKRRRKDGSFYEVSTRISPVRDKTGSVLNYVIVQSDISHELELERRLQQAQKMEAIGTLAGGIAHDFNNILFPIIMYAEMTLNELPDGRPRKNLEGVLEAAHRARELVQQILTFSRQNEGSEYRAIRLQPLIKESLKLLRASMPSTIRFRQRIVRECGPITGDPTQLHQLIVNLCTNAYHAMRETGGILDIGLNEAEIQADTGSDIVPGSYLKLSISDTGKGMSPDVLSRIFEPYFTTKPTGEGTGLGLSIVHGIVEKHGGHISVESQLGKGSIFNIYLPRVLSETHEPEPLPGKSIPGGRERILLVDDEEPVIHVEQEMLRLLGYSVKACLGSREALAAFQAEPEIFDLVITDMTMPGMTGTVLSRYLLDIRPDIPIILCTGFSEAVTAETAREAGIREFLTKPITTRQIAEVIRKVLDGNAC